MYHNTQKTKTLSSDDELEDTKRQCYHKKEVQKEVRHTKKVKENKRIITIIRKAFKKDRLVEELDYLNLSGVKKKIF